MKSISLFAIFLYVLLLLSLTGCDSDTNGDSPENEGEIIITSALTNAEIRLTPPEDWVTPEDNTIGLAYYRHSSVRLAHFMITENILPKDFNEPDQYVEFKKQVYADKYDNIEYGNTENLTIESYAGRKITFNYDLFGITIKYGIVYIFKDGYAYKLSLNAPASYFELLESDFDQFVDSINF